MGSHDQKIFNVVSTIPEGTVASYGLIADLAGLPGRARLVGKTLGNHNSKAHALPWHRVLRASGEISFPSGSEMFNEQRALLTNEGVLVKGRRVNMKQFGWKPSSDLLMFILDN